MLVYFYLFTLLSLVSLVFLDFKFKDYVKFGTVAVLFITVLNFFPDVLNQKYIEFKVLNPFLLSDDIDFFWFKLDELSLFFSLLTLVYCLTMKRISNFRLVQLILMQICFLTFNIKYVLAILFISELLSFSYLRLRKNIGSLYNYFVIFSSTLVFLFFQIYFEVNKIMYFDELVSDHITGPLFVVISILLFVKIINKFVILSRSLLINTSFFILLDIYLLSRLGNVLKVSYVNFFEISLVLLIVFSVILFIKNSSFTFRNEIMDLMILLMSSFSIVYNRADMFLYSFSFLIILRKINELFVSFCLENKTLKKYVYYIYCTLILPLLPVGFVVLSLFLFYNEVSITALLMSMFISFMVITFDLLRIKENEYSGSPISYLGVVLFLISFLVMPLIAFDNDLLQSSTLNFLSIATGNANYDRYSYSYVPFVLYTLCVLSITGGIYYLNTIGKLTKIVCFIEEQLFKYSAQMNFPEFKSSNKLTRERKSRTSFLSTSELIVSESTLLVLITVLTTFYLFSLLR